MKIVPLDLFSRETNFWRSILEKGKFHGYFGKEKFIILNKEILFKEVKFPLKKRGEKFKGILEKVILFLKDKKFSWIFVNVFLWDKNFHVKNVWG